MKDSKATSKIKLFLILILLINTSLIPKSIFISTSNGQFYQGKRPLLIRGCNYWYGGYLAFDTLHDGHNRLIHELDFLQEQGINNVRVFFCGEGNHQYPYRISPSVQEKPGQYNDQILKSFDVFLNEISLRNMTAVIVLNNNWEWSGGFGQYLQWATGKTPPLPKTPAWDWDRYCQYISKFYSCSSCNQSYKAWITTLLHRVNSVNGKRYHTDPSILAWELANEPRPMIKSAKPAFYQWIKSTSAFIRKMDANHLITIGSEGVIGTSMDTILFKKIQALPTIDYATIHIWPGIWKWYEGDPSHALEPSSLAKTKNYISAHASWMKSIGKPLVIEEFGLQRDGNSFSSMASTNHRDRYYQYVIETALQHQLNGINFWGFAGVPKQDTSSWFWKKGEPYSADPPQEQQGLFSVFEHDSSTWNTLRKAILHSNMD